MKQYENQAKLYKVLMHPVRLAILDILREGEECVCHMEAVLGYRQAYISQHLMVMREAGLVKVRRDGWNIFYRIIRPEVYAVMDAVRQFVGAPAIAFVTTSVACTCPNCTEGAGHKVKVPLELSAR